MRRLLPILTLLTAIAAPFGMAQAQTLTAAKIDSVKKAADAFVTLAKDSHTTGKPPRYSDPAAKPLIDAVFDTRDLQGNKPLPWSSMQMLMDWNRAIQTVGLVYYLAGTGAANGPEVAKDAKKIQRANQNTSAFADEFGRYYDAQIRMHSALIDTAAAAQASATPEQKKDGNFRTTLGGVSDSTANTMTGVLGSFVQTGVTDDWMLLRLVTLLEITGKAAKYMAPEDRLQVKTAAHEVSLTVKNADIRSGLNLISRTFEMVVAN